MANDDNINIVKVRDDYGPVEFRKSEAPDGNKIFAISESPFPDWTSEGSFSIAEPDRALAHGTLSIRTSCSACGQRADHSDSV